MIRTKACAIILLPMIVSAKTEYACIAVLELAARHGQPEPVRIRQIAEAHGIPSRFLVQILLQLKSAGLVQSTRGAAGWGSMKQAGNSMRARRAAP